MDAINKLLNGLINKSDVNVRITNSSNELLETLKIIENCTSCKKYNINEINFDELINEIELKKEEQEKYGINYKLIGIDDESNRKVLYAKVAKKKKIDKCGNEEMAKLFYQCKLNNHRTSYNIRRIPFNEFGNI